MDANLTVKVTLDGVDYTSEHVIENALDEIEVYKAFVRMADSFWLSTEQLRKDEKMADAKKTMNYLRISRQGTHIGRKICELSEEQKRTILDLGLLFIYSDRYEVYNGEKQVHPKPKDCLGIGGFDEKGLPKEELGRIPTMDDRWCVNPPRYIVYFPEKFDEVIANMMSINITADTDIRAVAQDVLTELRDCGCLWCDEQGFTSPVIIDDKVQDAYVLILPDYSQYVLKKGGWTAMAVQPPNEA